MVACPRWGPGERRTRRCVRVAAGHVRPAG
nr:MAG TPA: hypothetical protein [Caudoviricetes sp.]